MRGMHANEEREEDKLTRKSCPRVSIQVSVVWVAACLPVLPDAPFTFTAHIRAASTSPRARTSEKNAYAYDNGGACLRAILMGLREAIQYFSNPVIPPLSRQEGRQARHGKVRQGKAGR